MLSGAEDFVGYGAVFEGRGVVVDNYSVRSNNGQAMFWTNPSVNAQINAMLGYDLVVLQYGLNIMQPGVKNYTNYAVSGLWNIWYREAELQFGIRWRYASVSGITIALQWKEEVWFML